MKAEFAKYRQGVFLNYHFKTISTAYNFIKTEFGNWDYTVIF